MEADNDYGVHIAVVTDVIGRVRKLLGEQADIRLRTDGIVHPKGYHNGATHALWLIDWTYNGNCPCNKCVDMKERVGAWPSLEKSWWGNNGPWALYVCPNDEWQERGERASAKGDTWWWNEVLHRWQYIYG